MGKVGSSTIYQTLKDQLPWNHVLHVHFLSKNWLQNILPYTNHTYNIEAGKRYCLFSIIILINV